MTIVPFLQRFVDLIVNPLILLAFAVAFLYFVYGIFNLLYLDSKATDKTREEARNAILWGIIGMVIMFSVFGVIKFTLDTFGISNSDINSSGALQFLKL